MKSKYYLYCDTNCDKNRNLVGLWVCFDFEDSSLSEEEERDIELDLAIDIEFKIADIRVDKKPSWNSAFVGKKDFSSFFEEKILKEWIVPQCSSSITFTGMKLYHQWDSENAFETVFSSPIRGEEKSSFGLRGEDLINNISMLPDREFYEFQDAIGTPHVIEIDFPEVRELQAEFEEVEEVLDGENID